MDSLRTRLVKYTQDNGVKLSFIAKDADIDLHAIYRMNSESHPQKSLQEHHVINLHEYLKERGY